MRACVCVCDCVRARERETERERDREREGDETPQSAVFAHTKWKDGNYRRSGGFSHDSMHRNIFRVSISYQPAFKLLFFWGGGAKRRQRRRCVYLYPKVREMERVWCALTAVTSPSSLHVSLVSCG